MGNYSKKKHPVFTIILVLIWFFVLLPSIKVFFTELISPSNKFTLFEETEAELTELIQLEKAQFPEDFIKLKSQ